MVRRRLCEDADIQSLSTIIRLLDDVIDKLQDYETDVNECVSDLINIESKLGRFSNKMKSCARDLGLYDL